MRVVITGVVSAVIPVFIYWRVDVRALLDVLLGCDPTWLGLGLLLMIPPVLLGAIRLRSLVPRPGRLPYLEAVRLILVGGTLNMLLPSKMGDIAKAYFITRGGHLRGGFALSLVVFEKAWDMLALLAYCAIGLLAYGDKGPLFWSLTLIVVAGLVAGLMLVGSERFARIAFAVASRIAPSPVGKKLAGIRDAWTETRSYFWADAGRAGRIIAISLTIWLVHLLQIWVFIVSLGGDVSFARTTGLVPLALMVGLVPITLAGIGTRDAALIFFFRGYLTPPTAAALGVLCTLRYVVPALAGLPYTGRYLETVRLLRRGEEPR